MKSILVVCQGNICRSPYAQAVFQKLRPQWQVLSAGLGAVVGAAADSKIQSIALLHGMNLSTHRGLQVNATLMDYADKIFVMDAAQQSYAQNKYKTAANKIERLGKYLNQEIQDPYQRSQAVFDDVALLIDAAVRSWLPQLEASGV